MKPAPSTKADAPQPLIFGLTRRQRIRVYLWSVLALLVGFLIWSWSYLQPSRWYKYTDHVAFEQVARDVELGHVMWEPAAPELESRGVILQPSISSDGTRMVYSTGKGGGNGDLFLSRWDGTAWGEARPMRALNSAFHETAPALSGDGKYLFFASDRPGGLGGDDIWVAKWDGTDYAWPLPLTGRVNSPFDETDPALSPDGNRLYFASDRRYLTEEQALKTAALSGKPLEDVRDLKEDFDLYSADIAGDMPFDLLVDHQLSMLYSLRVGALADIEVMKKLGGSRETESAVDRGLAYLASVQEEDGRWDIGKAGGQRGHDVGATAFALLAFYGRGERHDQDCKYHDTVARGLEWLLGQQDRASGDLRGKNPQQNAMYDHGIASLALIEAYGVSKDSELRPRAAAAIEFMTSSQHAEGGWRYQPGERGDLSVTGWYIMALTSAKMSGIPVPDLYDVSLETVADPSELSNSGKSLVVVALVDGDLHIRIFDAGGAKVVDKAESELVSGREMNDLKGLSYKISSVTDKSGLSAEEKKRIIAAAASVSNHTLPKSTLEEARKFLKFVSGGENGGSFGYTDPPGRGNSNRHGMNAAGFFCSQLLGLSPNAAQAWESARILEKVGNGDGDLYYLYYGTIAAYQHQGPLWRGWRERMQERFVKSQQGDGSWNAGGGHGGAMGRVIGTAITVLCLEAHYRYTPLYGLGFEPSPDGPVEGALDQSQLPQTPLFRNARYLDEFNSPGDERAPVVTDHGDFLYCTSTRDGGFGGSDIYRARISGAQPSALENLGEEVNSVADETDPALRMEGFHLLFNRSGEGEGAALLTAKSRRLVSRHDYFKLPGFGWIASNFHWLLLFAGSAFAFGWLTRRALAADKQPPREANV